jgi:signal transduction histidine kinase
VASGVVQRHGGTIQVTSTPGLGSTSSVYLPASISQLLDEMAA